MCIFFITKIVITVILVISLFLHAVNQSNLLDGLNLTPADRDGVTDVTRRYGNQAGVAHALRAWQRVNPSRATFKALVEIAIELRREDTATEMCRFIVENTDRN